MCIFFFKQKTAYERRISDGSSDVCSSDLLCQHRASNPQSLRTLRCGPIRALCRHLAALNRGPIRFTARRRCIGCLSGTVPTQPGDIAMTLQAIRARQAQHVAAMRAVLNKATTEKRALAADEAHKCDAIKAD